MGQVKKMKKKFFSNVYLLYTIGKKIVSETIFKIHIRSKNALATPVNSKKSAHLGSFYQVLVLRDNVCTSQVHFTIKVRLQI